MLFTQAVKDCFTEVKIPQQQKKITSTTLKLLFLWLFSTIPPKLIKSISYLLFFIPN